MNVQGKKRRNRACEKRGNTAQARSFLSEISRFLSVVVIMGWRGPSVVVVGGRACCTHLEAS